MIENNNHTNNHFKLVHFKSKWQMFLLSSLVMQVLLVGCTAKDEESPVITSVKAEGNVVTIEANDNVGVTSYISVGNPRQPSLADENWQESKTITLDEDGTYYIWVKDASDNLAQYSETIEMSYNLALKFDHLNWLTPAEGTRDVDGVTYNLAELKTEYGDLYRLIEPLSKEEIERRFEYLARFMEIQREEAVKCNCGDWSIFGGLNFKNDINEVVGDNLYYIHEIIFKSNNTELLIFKNMYYYIATTGFYEVKYPTSFNSNKGVLGVGTDIIGSVPFADKNIFVRDFMMRYEMELNTYEQFGQEPEYAIANWD